MNQKRRSKDLDLEKLRELAEQIKEMTAKENKLRCDCHCHTCHHRACYFSCDCI